MSRMRVPSWSTRLFVISMIAASPLAAQPTRRRPPRPVVVRPSPTARVCLPGAQVTCACPGTSAGVQALQRQRHGPGAVRLCRGFARAHAHAYGTGRASPG